MKPWERWTFGLLALAVSATGFAYFWMRYLMVPSDPFAVVNHPWQGAMLSVHILASPWLLMMFGFLLNSHIMKKLGARNIPNRKSGLWSFGMFLTMAASGYLLQIATGELALQVLVVAHLVSGVVFSGVYVAHLVISVRLARAQAVRRLRVESAA